MCRENMTQHLEQECGLVEESCKLGCGAKMKRNELERHVKTICIQRMITCTHCTDDFKFCDMSEHYEQCPKMELSCELNCSVVICREKMAQHLEQECGQHVTNSRYT
eukprot:TRINITY_DN905_c0_g1_i6.p1 TRINITY_DN905_c0_g1~~TRINITY_DN905_c0_g1_i6.p1  ORF type:complete len:107 (-),score=7.74 TRINITY_DN905_c0_g1_i6:238-558(-)